MQTIIRIALVGSFGIALTYAEQPIFSFGVLADVQYADKDTAMGREYRQSPAKLAQCADLLNKEQLQFVIHLGDLIDLGIENLAFIGKTFSQIHAPKYHVLGNHDMEIPRDLFLKNVGMKRPYYHFSVKNWTFIVLDGMGESVAGGWPNGDPHEIAGQVILDRLRAEKAVNAAVWNGAVGSEQRQWLHTLLKEADGRHDRVAVFCHFPALPESCHPNHLLWDHKDVLQILDSYQSVAAYMNGHDHKGGSGLRNGVHFVTLLGMVENSVNDSCQVVDVYADSLVMRTANSKSGRVLKLR